MELADLCEQLLLPAAPAVASAGAEPRVGGETAGRTAGWVAEAVVGSAVGAAQGQAHGTSGSEGSTGTEALASGGVRGLGGCWAALCGALEPLARERLQAAAEVEAEEGGGEADEAFALGSDDDEGLEDGGAVRVPLRGAARTLGWTGWAVLAVGEGEDSAGKCVPSRVPWPHVPSQAQAVFSALWRASLACIAASCARRDPRPLRRALRAAAAASDARALLALAVCAAPVGCGRRLWPAPPRPYSLGRTCPPCHGLRAAAPAHRQEPAEAGDCYLCTLMAAGSRGGG
jgi:hypothetical protein